MKKILSIVLFILLVFTVNSYAANWMMFAPAGLTGGASGALDAIDALDADGAGYDLQNLDGCMVIISTEFSVYWFDIDNAGSEASPQIIKPDEGESGVGYTGDGRWLLLDVKAADLMGGFKLISDSDGITVTAAQAWGSMILESGNQQNIELPAVEAGMVVCAIATGADGSAEIYFDVNASDHIDLDGVSAANGEYIRNSTDAKNDYVCALGVGSNTWIIIGYRGTWVEQTPP